MTFFFNKKAKLFLTVLAAAVVLLLAALAGISKGRSVSQAKIIAGNAQNLAKGLDYFYNDQNRFPTAVEFQDQNLMLNYFNGFPPANISSAACAETFAYKRPSPQTYQLNFCLPADFAPYHRGWNAITKNYESGIRN
ncbi:MAG: hypothetical protein M1383_00990 [Patescibacteria group bacterium]|nr:hypothetical protein [Patescibacteria group bacterium]